MPHRLHWATAAVEISHTLLTAVTPPSASITVDDAGAESRGGLLREVFFIFLSPRMLFLSVNAKCISFYTLAEENGQVANLA